MTSDQPDSSAMNGNLEQQEVAPQRLRARRLPAGERRATILNEASAFFAEQGFSASTRDLADRLGVRQALLYKYYESKEALLQAIFDKVFADRLQMDFADGLSDRNHALEDRLVGFYQRYNQDENGISLRLFLRAALDGWPLPTQLVNVLLTKVVGPVVDELRSQSNLPALAHKPLMVGEREMVLGLHAAILFHSLRAEIFHFHASEDAGAAIRLHVSSFLRGAGATMESLHSDQAPQALSATAQAG
jgi:AcrR family transcriptional regulator